MNQVIVFFGGIGDTILFSPAVKQLSRRGEITFVGYPERLAILRSAGWVKNIYSPEQVDFETIFSKPSDKLKIFLSQFAKAYFLIRDAQRIVEVAKDCGVKDIVAIPGIPPDNWDRHASEYYLSSLNLEMEDDFIIPVQSSFIHSKIVIHPGSGSSKKNLPLQFFIDITAHFLSLGKELAWCLGPAEEDVMPPNGIEILRNVPLSTLAQFIKSAPLYIGNDCGISHIAGAVGTPTIVLFKSTNPVVWKPLGPHVFPIIANGDPFQQVLYIVQGVLSVSK